jgi:hypothetical protein
MEPDSSTDLSLGSSHHHQVPINEATVAKDHRAANQSTVGVALANQHVGGELEDEDELELEQEKIFQNSKHFAQARGPCRSPLIS